MQRRVKTVALGAIMTSALTAGLLGSVGPATAEPAAPAAAPATMPVTPGTIAWGTCANPAFTARGLQCATLQVPLDHDKPRGRTITLALSRLPHTVPDSQYQGVMLLNPGGPGGSGLTLPVLRDRVPQGAGQAYDWIGFDPRGVGSSVPALSCDPNYPTAYNRPAYNPTTPEIEQAWLTRAANYTAACARNNDPELLNNMTTVDVARDLDLIRQATGQSQINYYGFSYGTYIGQVYSTLFPTNVRRQIFDGTVDPRDVWYQANLNQDVAFEVVINRWFDWIARNNAAYGLGATQAEVRKVWFDTRDRLTATPVQGEGGLLGGSEWTDAFLSAGYSERSWPDLASAFSLFVRNGDVAAFEGAYGSSPGDNGSAVYSAVQCTDEKWPQRFSIWRRDNDRINAIAPYETWANAWFNAPCLTWPAKTTKPLNINGRRIESTLMINETFDAPTPFAGSLEVRQRFPGARLIEVRDGATHSGSLSGNPCTDNAIAAYLATGALPPRVAGIRQADVVCPRRPEPTAVAPTAAAMSAELNRVAEVPQDFVADLVGQGAMR